MSADRGRAEVYSAEAAAFDGTDLETLVPFETIAVAVEAVVTGEWWPGRPVRVQAARGDAASSSARSVEGAATVLRFAARQMTIATAAHELAHALAGSAAGHSPVFVAAYLDVVAVITNLDSRDRRHQLHVDQLSQAFGAVGLVAGRRRWPAPPESIGTAIVL